MLSADYHQQCLAKNPDGCCELGGYGVSFKFAPRGVTRGHLPLRIGLERC